MEPDKTLDQLSMLDAPVTPSGVEVERYATKSDRSIEYVARQAKKAGQPIRVRVNISLFDPKTAQYKGWRGMVWKVPVADIDAARQLQACLELFFDVVEIGGLNETRDRLENVKAGLQAEQKEQ